MDVEFSNPLLKFLSLPSALIFNSLFKQADKIICASLDYVENGKLKNIYKNFLEKFIEIPFGVDIEKFHPAFFCHPERSDSEEKDLKSDNILKAPIIIDPSASLCRPQDDKIFTILFVGGLDKAHYFKGINVLLEAIAQINSPLYKEGRSPSGRTGCVLNIIGSGNLEEEYKNKSRLLGISGRVKFLGNVSDNDLPKKYQEADCFVLPSINKGEAFGIVLIEALASGLPVIASDLPGVRGVFKDGQQGLFTKPGDACDLAKKIKYLIDNQGIREKMAVEARNLAEEKYDQKKIEEKLIGVLVN